MHYTPDWDLSTIPADAWASENARRIKPPAPRPRVEVPCIGCGVMLSARERRKPCPHCGVRPTRGAKATI